MTDPDEELEFGLELEGDDILDSENESFEVESDYPQVITNKWVYFSTIHRGKILVAACSVLLLLVTLAIVTAIVVPIAIVFTGSESESESESIDKPDPTPTSEVFVVPPTPDMEDEFIRNSSEYQIVLSSLVDWVDREKILSEWLDEINTNFSDDFHLERNEGKTSARNQYKLSANNEATCNSTYDFRVRDYIDGFWEGNTYIDIKGNSESKDNACSMPCWPSDEQSDNSAQKCEQDIHACSTKFSRETRIFYDHHPEFTKCIDLLKLYPWAFENLLPENQQNPIEKISPQHWWTVLYNGTILDETRYEMAWTLQYGTENEALTGNGVPNYGEWSIRIYTLDDGRSSSYDASAQDLAAHLWEDLISLFGNDDKNVNCSRTNL